MHVKNHMAMWFLWFLWFLRIEYSGNQLYKPLCAFLVFVDLVWFLCGRLCGFWSCVVFGCGLASMPIAVDCASTWRRALWICGFLAVVLRSMPIAVDCASTWRRALWIGGLALDADAVDCASTWRRALWICGLARPLASMPMPTFARRSCASTCYLWTDKKICSLPRFVLCSLSSSLEATFTEWRKRSWLERP